MMICKLFKIEIICHKHANTMTQILIYHIKEIMSGAMLIAMTMIMRTTTVMNILRMKLSRDVVFNMTMSLARKFWY
jgi:hypothetical protein